ncbi:MAG: hypothetical protein FWC67_03355 [Defluviitaleaceae bacterium]|nr:hypothetical protein [Defluviitaleaceae bacterium]
MIRKDYPNPGNLEMEIASATDMTGIDPEPDPHLKKHLTDEMQNRLPNKM